MKKSHNDRYFALGVLAAVLVGSLALGTWGSSFKTSVPDFPEDSPNFSTCHKYQRWISGGTLTKNARGKDLSDAIEQCRAKYPQTMKTSVPYETCVTYRKLKKSEKRQVQSRDRRSYDQIMAVCNKNYPANRRSATAINENNCKQYRIWELAGELTKNATDYTTVVNGCRKLFRNIMKGPDEETCALYREWTEAGALTENGADLKVAEMCRHVEF